MDRSAKQQARYEALSNIVVPSFFRPTPLIVFIRRDFCSQSSFSILRILTILSRNIFPFPGFHFSPFFFHPCCLSSLVTGDKVISASSFVKTRFKCKYNRNLKIVMQSISFFSGQMTVAGSMGRSIILYELKRAMKSLKWLTIGILRVKRKNTSSLL